MHPSYLGYRAGALAARLLPEVAVRPTSAALGAIGAMAMGPRRRIVERNLERAGADPSRVARATAVAGTFGSYARYWVESFRLPGTEPAELDAGFSVQGYERIQAGLDAGSGVILALPHLGGWEWAAFWLAAVKQVPVTAVVEPVEPPELAEWFLGLRRSIGINAVTLGPSAATEVMRALRHNHILSLLCDRDLGGGGVEVEFFGETTTLPAGPTTLALRSGAPLCPAGVYFDGRHRVGQVRPPLDTTRRGRLRDDVARITQDLAGELEALIRKAPDQWHLMQPNWPSDRMAKGSRVAGPSPGGTGSA